MDIQQKYSTVLLVTLSLLLSAAAPSTALARVGETNLLNPPTPSERIKTAEGYFQAVLQSPKATAVEKYYAYKEYIDIKQEYGVALTEQEKQELNTLKEDVDAAVIVGGIEHVLDKATEGVVADKQAKNEQQKPNDTDAPLLVELYGINTKGLDLDEAGPLLLTKMANAPETEFFVGTMINAPKDSEVRTALVKIFYDLFNAVDKEKFSKALGTVVQMNADLKRDFEKKGKPNSYIAQLEKELQNKVNGKPAKGPAATADDYKKLLARKRAELDAKNARRKTVLAQKETVSARLKNNEAVLPKIQQQIADLLKESSAVPTPSNKPTAAQEYAYTQCALKNCMSYDASQGAERKSCVDTCRSNAGIGTQNSQLPADKETKLKKLRDDEATLKKHNPMDQKYLKQLEEELKKLDFEITSLTTDIARAEAGQGEVSASRVAGQSGPLVNLQSAVKQVKQGLKPAAKKKISEVNTLIKKKGKKILEQTKKK